MVGLTFGVWQFKECLWNHFRFSQVLKQTKMIKNTKSKNVSIKLSSNCLEYA